MENGKKKVTTRKQFECLVSYMEAHPSVAKGLKFSETLNSKESYKKLWEGISSKLNSLGPPIRSVTQWQKVWADFKNKVRKKLVQNKKEFNSTGGGVNKLNQVTALEESVVHLLSLDRIVKGGKQFGLSGETGAADMNLNKQTERIEKGLESELEKEIEFLLDRTESSNTLDNSVQKTNASYVKSLDTQRSTERKKNKEKEENYKETLLKAQAEDLKEIITILKENARYTKKAYYLKQEKFQFYKQKVERKGKRKQDEIKVQMEILEYKKEKLELEEMNNSLRKQ